MKELEALEASLSVLSLSLRGQEKIKVVSVAGNGVVKVVLDSEKVSVGDLLLKEGIVGGIIAGGHASLETDARSNSIFITIRP
jgi:hypothetical protein